MILDGLQTAACAVCAITSEPGYFAVFLLPCELVPLCGFAGPVRHFHLWTDCIFVAEMQRFMTEGVVAVFYPVSFGLSTLALHDLRSISASQARLFGPSDSRFILRFWAFGFAVADCGRFGGERLYLKTHAFGYPQHKRAVEQSRRSVQPKNLLSNTIFQKIVQYWTQ